MTTSYDIIIRPILSEKSFSTIKQKMYTFVVHKDATKPQIKKAIEEIFKVKVEKVNTARYDGKPKRHGRHEGTTSAWKKAYVQLTADSKPIEFFESLQ
jgi:large subunit ribosomal protein L23